MDEQELIRTANGYQPSDSQALTEGYQPQGSNAVPTVVPRLVSGVCVATASSAPAQIQHAPGAECASET